MTKLDQLKQRAEFFPRGKVIPNRVLKCPVRKMRHNVTFGADPWVIPCPTGYVCFSHYEPGNSCIHIDGDWGAATREFFGSPYHKGG